MADHLRGDLLARMIEQAATPPWTRPPAALAAAGIPSPRRLPPTRPHSRADAGRSGGQPIRRAITALQRASAIGLRQVFPVQTNKMITPAHSATSRSGTAPGWTRVHPASSIATTVGSRLRGGSPSRGSGQDPGSGRSHRVARGDVVPPGYRSTQTRGPDARRRISRVNRSAGEVTTSQPAVTTAARSSRATGRPDPGPAGAGARLPVRARLVPVACGPTRAASRSTQSASSPALRAARCRRPVDRMRADRGAGVEPRIESSQCWIRPSAAGLSADVTSPTPESVASATTPPPARQATA